MSFQWFGVKLALVMCILALLSGERNVHGEIACIKVHRFYHFKVQSNLAFHRVKNVGAKWD